MRRASSSSTVRRERAIGPSATPNAVTTKMVRHYGRSPRGKRLVSNVPHGHWKTLTLVAALRIDGLTTPYVIYGAMDGPSFLAYVEQVLVPTLHKNDILFMDNLRTHKIVGVAEALGAAGATVRYLPAYSPDLNPIEMAFSKLKTALRKGAARTVTTLIKLIGKLIKTFAPDECANYFRHAAPPNVPHQAESTLTISPNVCLFGRSRHPAQSLRDPPGTSQHRFCQLGLATTPVAAPQSCGADRSDHRASAVEYAGADAGYAFGVLLIVDRIAKAPDFGEFLQERRTRGDGLGRAPLQVDASQQCLGRLQRQARQQCLADRRAMRQLAPAKRGIEANGARTVNPANHNGIAIFQDGDARGQAYLVGQLPQFR